MSKIKCRALEPEDVNLLYLWENDPEIWTISHVLTPFSKFTLNEFISASIQDIYSAKQLRLMIDEVETDHCVGVIDIFDFDPYHQRAGVGILIEKSARRKGYASEAVQIVVDYLFNTLNLHQIYCNILAENTESFALFTNAGFTVAGLKKDWILDKNGFHDEYILQLIRP